MPLHNLAPNVGTLLHCSANSPEVKINKFSISSSDLNAILYSDYNVLTFKLTTPRCWIFQNFKMINGERSHYRYCYKKLIYASKDTLYIFVSLFIDDI